MYAYTPGGTIALDADGFNVVRRLEPGTKPNPETVTKNGFVKSFYTSLQARLLAGEKFDTTLPTDPYLQGLYYCGQAATLGGGELVHTQMYLGVVNEFGGFPVIGGTHYLKVVGLMAQGMVAVFKKGEQAYEPAVDPNKAWQIWNGITKRQEAFLPDGMSVNLV